jgi:hypothetical protein
MSEKIMGAHDLWMTMIYLANPIMIFYAMENIMGKSTINGGL